MHTTIKIFPLITLALLTTCIRATPNEELIKAARSNNEEGVRLALEYGANPDTTHLFSTALHCASYYDNPRMAQFLLDQSANKEARNDRGMTPLHLTAYWYSLDVAKLLLDAGAQNTEDDDGITPRKIAHYCHHHEISILFKRQKRKRYKHAIHRSK